MLGSVALPVRRLISRGYRPVPQPPPPTDCLVGLPGAPLAGAPPAAVAALLGASVAGGVGVVLPTCVDRAAPAAHRAVVADLLARLDELRAAEPGRPVVLLLGMQWGPGEDDAARDRLRDLCELVGDRPVPVVGIAMPRVGKAPMLNAAFRIATAAGLAGVGWVDDDVRLGPGCLARLVAAFRRRGCRGSAGARKVPRPHPYAAARLLHRGKLVGRTPRYAYPHGCCMIVDAALAARGIPDRYTCEDDYFCFALIDPAHPDPLHRMHIVPDALCYHAVGGPAGEIRRRVTRSLRTAAVLLADFPAPVAAIYFSMYFHGLWPLAAAARGHGAAFAARKWAVKSLHFLWFARVALALAARGLVGRPLAAIPWAAYSRHDRPPPAPLPVAAAAPGVRQ
ncbi:hypothetical protein GCM10010123_40640 [Pilimelia anulata]|uniref:Glycosyltransferase 2-like domain-containing protein n=1 Tax=Pilimelia anulata TaxID=53371 RepID=A0A8J3BFE5_9ACTN|nr:glycosyltransferase [Pilimelia anulata]GGK06744.1 hypothetical protein GCM10010123_40640 [Pilimelia anulata]